MLIFDYRFNSPTLNKTIFLIFLVAVLLTSYSKLAAAEEWAAVTWDNDFFVGDDSGYTNGLYMSWFKVKENANNHAVWVKPFLWSMPSTGVNQSINSYSIGQTLGTPKDITIENPEENELPYSAILSITNHYVAVSSHYADRISIGIGLVGPLAFGEETQKFIHKVIGSDEPKGWDTQLNNEMLFIISRARSWRYWVAESNKFDILSSAEFNLGTIQSSAQAGFTLRYGQNLKASFPSTLYTSSRSSNPVAVDGGWYFFSGLKAGYIFNQIATDGNTYRDSRSIDYKHEYIGIALGFAYSWGTSTLTFAINDLNIIQSGRSKKPLDSLTQFGTLTFAWQL